LSALPDTVSLASLPLRALLDACPEALARLQRERTEAAGPAFGPVAERLAPSTRRALVEQGRMPLDERWLRQIPVPERRELADLGLSAQRDAEACVPAELLQCLPSAVRHSEARRHLALPALSTRPLDRLGYAALLPWTECEAEAGPLLGHPDASKRGAALAALIACVRFERGRAREALGLVAERKNEQDPVRHAAIRALASLPPSVWEQASPSTLALASPIEA
jgi:hypothetical protein